MNNFDFYNPVNVVFGEGVLTSLGEKAIQYGKKAVLVSYTDISFFGDLFDISHKSLEQSGIEYKDYLVVEANPTIAQAKGGVACIFRTHLNTLSGALEHFDGNT